MLLSLWGEVSLQLELVSFCVVFNSDWGPHSSQLVYYLYTLLLLRWLHKLNRLCRNRARVWLLFYHCRLRRWGDLWCFWGSSCLCSLLSLQLKLKFSIIHFNFLKLFLNIRHENHFILEPCCRCSFTLLFSFVFNNTDFVGYCNLLIYIAAIDSRPVNSNFLVLLVATWLWLLAFSSNWGRVLRRWIYRGHMAQILRLWWSLRTSVDLMLLRATCAASTATIRAITAILWDHIVLEQFLLALEIWLELTGRVWPWMLAPITPSSVLFRRRFVILSSSSRRRCWVVQFIVRTVLQKCFRKLLLLMLQLLLLLMVLNAIFSQIWELWECRVRVVIDEAYRLRLRLVSQDSWLRDLIHGFDLTGRIFLLWTVTWLFNDRDFFLLFLAVRVMTTATLWHIQYILEHDFVRTDHHELVRSIRHGFLAHSFIGCDNWVISLKLEHARLSRVLDRHLFIGLICLLDHWHGTFKHVHEFCFLSFECLIFVHQLRHVSISVRRYVIVIVVFWRGVNFSPWFLVGSLRIGICLGLWGLGRIIILLLHILRGREHPFSWHDFTFFVRRWFFFWAVGPTAICRIAHMSGCLLLDHSAYNDSMDLVLGREWVTRACQVTLRVVNVLIFCRLVAARHAILGSGSLLLLSVLLFLFVGC